MERTAHDRHAKNAPGDWYATGHCMACGAPEAEAPELFAPLTDENYETYFVRQPRTQNEVQRACAAAHSCCVSAVRYGGTDPDVIRSLGNTAEFTDYIVGSSGRLQAAGYWPPPRVNWWQFWKRLAAR